MRVQAFKDSPAKAPRGMQTIRRCVYSKHGIQTTFAASRHFSEHAVIKFLNKQGQDLGQGILPVNRRYLHVSPTETEAGWRDAVSRLARLRLSTSTETTAARKTSCC